MASALGLTDSIGRFGYGAQPGLANLGVNLSGLVANYPKASRVDFASPAVRFVPTATHSTDQECVVEGGPNLPKKIRTTLIGNSVDLYFENGLTLVCKSVGAPFLTWPESSVGPGVPTADVKWLLVSFADAEPPLLFGFSDSDASFKVTGSEGAWTISSPDFGGWLRVWLPLGLDPQFATDASGLGRMSKEVEPFADVWQGEAPTVKSLKLKSNESSVDATWTFTSEGAFVPEGALLAQLGGSSLEFKSQFRTLPGEGEDGMRAVIKGRELSLHFPCLRIPSGRSLGLGASPSEPLASVALTDLPSLVELGNEAMLANGDDALLKLADDTVTRFLTETSYVTEPNTGQQLPFGTESSGIAVAAAQAYLSQCAMVALGSTQPNAIFDSVFWKRDWWTWTIWTGESTNSRRATALAALAGAMSSDPNARFYGATLEAGLDAQRGLQIYRTRKKLSNPKEELAEPLLGLRTGFFVLGRIRETNLDYFHLLQSPIKLGIGPAVELKKPADGYVLEWRCDEPKPSSFNLFCLSATPSAIPLENIDKLEFLKDKDSFKLAYKPLGLGSCRIILAFSPATLVIPKEVAAPSF